MGIAILAIIVLSTFLLLQGLYSRSCKRERVAMESKVSQYVITRIENVRTSGREKNGWRNNFPSVLGWERTTLQVAKDFVLITGKSNFPFIFATEIEPFLIAMQPERLKNELRYDRIFRPSDIRITNYGSDLELTIRPPGLFGPMEIHLTFENLGKRQIEELFAVANWRKL